MILKSLNHLKSAWYWFFAALLLLIFFVASGHDLSQVFYFITCLLPVVIGTAYYVNHKLIPEYLLRKKYGLFILYSIYTLIISLYFQFLIIFLALLLFATFQMNDTALLTIDIGNLSLTLYILVLVKVVIEIIKKLNQKETLIESLEKKYETEQETGSEKINVRFNRVQHSIETDDIIYIESLSDYIKLVTVKEEIVTKERISKIINRLPSHFIRTHRSFIVNSQKINSYNREFITLDSYQIPISRTYKEDFITYAEENL